MTGIALIAGQGALPAALARALPEGGFRIWHLDGFAPEGLASEPFRVERLGSLVATLTEAGMERVCFAGAIARPRLDPSAVDAATMPLVPRILRALQAGDDGALRAVIAVFEEAGIEVVGAQDLAPSLLEPPETGAPTDRDLADIARARAVHAALAPLDIGQGCVVAGGQVLAVEALPGTDWMLASLTRLTAKPAGGILFKASKPGQDRRIDMATIGPATVRRAAEAGLCGIAVERGGVLVLDGEEIRARLAETGLFLTALDP